MRKFDNPENCISPTVTFIGVISANFTDQQKLIPEYSFLFYLKSCGLT